MKVKKRKEKEKRARPPTHLAFRPSEQTLSSFQMPPADGESPRDESQRDQGPQPALNNTYSAEQRALAMEQLMSTTTTGGDMPPHQPPLARKPGNARFWTSFALAAAKKRLMLAKNSSSPDVMGAMRGDVPPGPGSLKQRSLSEAGKQMFIDGTSGSFGQPSQPAGLQTSVTGAPKFQRPSSTGVTPLDPAGGPGQFFMAGQSKAAVAQPTPPADLPVAHLVAEPQPHPNVPPFSFGGKPFADAIQQQLQLTTLAHPSMSQGQQGQPQTTAAQQQQQQQMMHQQSHQKQQQLGMALTMTASPQQQQQQQHGAMFRASRPASLNLPFMMAPQQQQQMYQQQQHLQPGRRPQAGAKPRSGDHSPSYFNRASHDARRSEGRSSGGSENDLSFQRPSGGADLLSRPSRNSTDEFFSFIDRNSFETRASLDVLSRASFTNRDSYTDRNSFLSAGGLDRNSFTSAGRPSAEAYRDMLRQGGHPPPHGMPSREPGSAVPLPGPPPVVPSINSNASGSSVFGARGSMNLSPGSNGWSTGPLPPTGEPPPHFPANFRWDGWDVVNGGEGGDGEEDLQIDQQNSGSSHEPQDVAMQS